MRVFALTLSLLLVWLLYTLMWGKNGVMDFRAVQAEIEVAAAGECQPSPTQPRDVCRN